jgi:GxxExxY protein
MPILRSLNLPAITDAEFARIDKAVMNHAYDIQNRMGRLFDERIYENELADRLRLDGFETVTQVPVQVVHGSFSKTYYLDLIVSGMVYELKVVENLHHSHKAQALHYAMLQGVRLVKLLNFGAGSIQGDLLKNLLDEPDRHLPVVRNSGWWPSTPFCDQLIDHLRALLSDWGTHLSGALYNEALIHHLGGESHCLKRLDVRSVTAFLGSHLVQMHAPNAAFHLTTLSDGQTAYQRQLQQVFDRIPLQVIQWINLNHARVEITTLSKTQKQAVE